MSLSYTPTIDDLLADSLIQTVMRADHVEPQAVRSLMRGVASRIGAQSRGVAPQRPAVVFVGSPNDRRTAYRGGNPTPAVRRPGRARDADCGSALCC
jgi:hypothetical protein